MGPLKAAALPELAGVADSSGAATAWAPCTIATAGLAVSAHEDRGSLPAALQAPARAVSTTMGHVNCGGGGSGRWGGAGQAR